MSSSHEHQRKYAVIVDDTDVVRDVLCKYIESLGYQSVSASNGVQGLEALESLKKKKCSVDLIISDVMMPEMDGFAFLKAVRLKPEFRQTSFLIVTGAGNEIDRISAENFGADGYIYKPITLDQIKKFLDTKKPRKAA